MEIKKNKPIRLKGKKLRKLYQQVIERDEACVDCGTSQNLDSPHHIKFKSQGGGDTMDNLELLCRRCHGLKHGINHIY